MWKMMIRKCNIIEKKKQIVNNFRLIYYYKDRHKPIQRN